MSVKAELAKKAGEKSELKLNRNMNIVDMIKALEPEIMKALPTVITRERFTRMALSAINKIESFRISGIKGGYRVAKW